MNLAYRLAQSPVQRPDLPASLAVNPGRAQWLSWTDDDHVEVRSGKVEIGQGILTALAQIAASELRLPVQRIRMISASTDSSPDEAVTSGSLSVQESGTAIRIVCAELRERLIERAATRWGIPAERCEARDGQVHSPDHSRSIDYARLGPSSLLEGEVEAGIPAKVEAARVRAANEGHSGRPVGESVPRLDLPAKLIGEPVYIHDLALPGMLHARVLRSGIPGARLIEVDESVLTRFEGRVRLWRDGDFLAVTSDSEWMAVKAATAIEPRLRWESPVLPFDEHSVGAWLREQPTDSKVIAQKPDTASSAASTDNTASSSPTLDATYTKPFIAHASLMPSCAVALWKGEHLEVWSHSQGIFNLRADLALVFPGSSIDVHHSEGAGCYGHNGADDAALDAALVARLCGAPVRLLWSRRDELRRAPFGSVMSIRVRAWLDNGRIRHWEHEVWSGGYSLRPGRAPTPTLLAATEIASNRFAPREAVNAALAAGGGAERNAIPGYAFESLKVVNHRVTNMPLRTSALRSLGAFGNVFALESSIDDLARMANADPLQFRLAHLEDVRGRRVLATLQQLLQDPPDTTDTSAGRGIAYARYKNSGAWCAVAAHISVTDRIIVERLTVVADIGCVINPDGARNQLEGGALQACSWALLEAVPIDPQEGPSATDWTSYPIMSFSDQPKVHVELIAADDQPSLGAGECAQGPVVAAIANALRDAVGLRVRDLPLTRERLMQAAADS